MKYKIGIVAFVLSIVAVGAAFATGEIFAPQQVSQQKGFGAGQTVVMYKSPNCGCCSGYAQALEAEGFRVEVVKDNDMASEKERFGIPQDKQSCHTIAMGDYVVEGHVPLEAVAKLLKEKPEIDGIGLPRMPAGTPGMPGVKRAPYEVYQLNNGVASPYVTI